MQNKGLIAAILSLVVIGGLIAIMGISTSNKEVRLRNRAEAQQEQLHIVYDRVWKILQQKAGVSDKYADDFKEIYPQLMEGRYGDTRGGAMMSWITESNPNFDTSLYADLMRSIEAERTAFAREQTEMVDIKRVHDDLRETFPSSLFVGGRPEIEYQLVTSARTKEAFATGEENDVTLFGE